MYAYITIDCFYYADRLAQEATEGAVIDQWATDLVSSII
jgi:hypothetical protein